MAGLWTTLLAGGAVEIWRRPKQPPRRPAQSGGCLSQIEKTRLPHWTAIRAMQPNWLLRDADLRDPGGDTRPASFAGKYVACKVAAGEMLVESDLALKYNVAVVSQKVLFELPASSPREQRRSPFAKMRVSSRSTRAARSTGGIAAITGDVHPRLATV